MKGNSLSHQKIDIDKDFYEAIKASREELARAIYSAHPNLDVNKHGALHWAVMFRKEKIVDFILSIPSINVNAYMMSDSTPLMLALTHNYIDEEKIKAIKKLMSYGADINLGKKNGESPLTFETSLVVARFLIDRGSDVNIVDNETGWSLLMKHCDAEKSDIVKLLLESGKCNTINFIGRYGYTALLIAVEKNLSPVVTLLLKYGADPTIPTPSGRSLLEIATNEDIHRSLLRVMRSRFIHEIIDSKPVDGKVVQPAEICYPPATALSSKDVGPDKGLDFVPAATYQGDKKGFQYRNGNYGFGYYQTTVTKKKKKGLFSRLFGSSSDNRKASTISTAESTNTNGTTVALSPVTVTKLDEKDEIPMKSEVKPAAVVSPLDKSASALNTTFSQIDKQIFPVTNGVPTANAVLMVNYGNQQRIGDGASPRLLLPKAVSWEYMITKLQSLETKVDDQQKEIDELKKKLSAMSIETSNSET
jgi:ankyrin repeat protein